jgi:hypothetical protein
MNNNKDESGSDFTKKISNTDIVMFLADQDDIREEQNKFCHHGSIYKTLVEPRPPSDECEEELWDSYIVIDGLYYHIGTFDTELDANRSARINNIRLEKMAKDFVSDIVMETMSGG